MNPIVEYYALPLKEGGMKLSAVFLDGDGWVPEIMVDPACIIGLQGAFFRGVIQFISCDEHPKLIVKIDVNERKHCATISLKGVEGQLAHDFDLVDWTELLTVKNNKFTPLRVGTLSSQLNGDDMNLADNLRGFAVIIDAINRHNPDVLLTAGHSINDEQELSELVAHLNDMSWNGLLFVEVKHYLGDLPLTVAEQDLSSHCLFAWSREAGLQRMGRQYFTTSEQARQFSNGRAEMLIENLSNRVVDFKGRRFGALICGEINALQGRDMVQAISPELDVWLKSIDVVVNPTHDLMGNAGTVKAKRTYLSRGGRSYISASNWNIRKKIGNTESFRSQTRSTDTLHTVFVDGLRERPVKNVDQHVDYEYREVNI